MGLISSFIDYMYRIYSIHLETGLLKIFIGLRK